MNLTPCHTGAAALTCAFDAALAEVDVDTAELAAVTRPELQVAMLQVVLNAITCIPCGAPYGRAHNPGCPQTSFRDGADTHVDASALGGILVLNGVRGA